MIACWGCLGASSPVDGGVLAGVSDCVAPVLRVGCPGQNSGPRAIRRGFARGRRRALVQTYVAHVGDALMDTATYPPTAFSAANPRRHRKQPRL